MPDDTYLFSPPPIISVPVAGTDARFPVRRIYCVGRNYAAHVREMGGDDRDPPFFFQKPRDAIVIDGAAVPYPPVTADFHYEIEFVLAIGTGGALIAPERALGHVFGVAAGIDLTRRDAQAAAKAAGLPWEIAKAFDHSAPIGRIRRAEDGGIPEAGEISLAVNGETRQKGDLAEMIWRPAEIIHELSRQYRLEAGDLIYTGTPAGIGPIRIGDRVTGRVEGVGEVAATIIA